MAIVRMKKVILAAPQSERDNILNFLQSKGYVELIDSKESIQDFEGVDCFKTANSVPQAEIDYNRIKFTYDFLKQYNSKKKSLLAKKDVITKQEFDSLETQINWQNIYEQCKKIDDTIGLTKNKKSKIISLIDQYTEWENLDAKSGDLQALKSVSYFIGTLNKKYGVQLYEDLKRDYNDLFIEKISEKKDNLNLFILCHNNDREDVSDILKKYGFAKMNLDLDKSPKEQINGLNGEIEALNKDSNELNLRAVELSQKITDIERIYDYLSNKLEKENSISKLVKTKKTVVLQGWITEDNAHKLNIAVDKEFHDVYLEFNDPMEDDIPPIVLKNNAITEPFEAITAMYALPQHTEVDPTPVLTPFYLIFFGMMAGDIGYGVVLLLVTLFALKYMEFEGETRKLIKLLFMCSIPTIIFGWVFGGFFGNAIFIKPLWVNPVDNPMQVLYVSVALGLIHLFTGLGVKAYWLIKNGKLLDAVFDVFFWYIMLTGLLWMLISGMVGLGGGEIAKYASILGAAGILLTSGRGNETFTGKAFGGIYALYGVTSYIGDILSYSRLLALSLATGLIGSSFNLLIGLLGKGFFAVIFGILIFIGGHTFNFLIGLLGTFVHTCRLEYLEFFGKFYEGGGKAFEPLKLRTKFIRVNTQK